MSSLSPSLPAPLPGRPEVLPAESPAIHTLDLVKRYRRGTTAVAGLTMSVRRGEVFGFLGPNGAGKTTAVKLLVGLTRATSGEAWVLGERAGDRLTRKQIGYLPELFRYQDWMSAREVLSLHCKLAGIPRQMRVDEIDHALELVGLADRGRDRVGTFSKGMQQRLGLGVALLGRPALVFLDEPTSALDPVGRHDVRQIIRDLRRRRTTVFLNSHLLREVEQVCDRVAVIDKGKVIAQGTLDELRGGGHSVRLRIGGGAPADIENVLARVGGAVAIDGDWYTIEDIDMEAIPALISDLVAAAVRIYAVEPCRQTLEDRFLQLLGGSQDGSADHSAHHAS